MTPDRWQQIKTLLHSALERDPNERAAFLNQACAGNASLQSEVESLIASYERAGSFVERPAFELMADILADEHAESMVGRAFGPYQIIAWLGAGGMGEVYRARDTRLGREVAIKVLPSAFSTDEERLRRFEQEARAASALNHPNILVIHDVGTHDGSPYVVSELLQGVTLRGRLGETPIPTRKAVDYALQIAQGLAAAHERGIIHRDLKPENLFITADGRVKILDFGLAKLIKGAGALHAAQAEAPTMRVDAETGSGMVMGTAGYMSPEQVRGLAVDHRSDIFSSGAILYEMLSGERAFRGESAIETMNAVLKEEPAELSETNRNIPPSLERIVRHCLEKNPEERFQSARDLAFDLEALSGLSGQSASAASAVAPARPKLRRLLPLLLGAVLLAAVALAAFYAGRRAVETSPPSFQRLTFRRGYIHAARFAPDGRTIIYSAAWDGQPIQLFSTHPESPESRPLGFPDADLLSISSTGEMAVSLGRHPIGIWIHTGTLARMPLAGAAPREILEDVHWADWSPDRANLAIVRDVGGRNRLEYPAGKVLYETAGFISHPRVSPKGDLIAFLDHPARSDDGGSVAVVDLNGNKTTLSSGHSTERGLAWAPNGDEVWFTAGHRDRALYAVTPTGKARRVARGMGGMTLQDISRDGRVLIAREDERLQINCLPPGEIKERDLSWHDWSAARDLSDDGKTLLIGVSGDAGGVSFSSYLRKTDGSPAIRLGEGWALALSPDGKWVIASVSRQSNLPVQLVLLPTGAGETKPLTNDAINYNDARWLSDGKRLLFQGNEPGHARRLYLRDLAGGTPRAIAPEGVTFSRGTHPLSPDGKLVIGIDPEQKVWIYPVEGGEPRQVPGLVAGDVPIRWAADGRSIYVGRLGELPVRVYRLNLSTGRRELWKETTLSDPVGVKYVTRIVLTPDGKSYAYSYYRHLSDLYLVEGLK